VQVRRGRPYTQRRVEFESRTAHQLPAASGSNKDYATVSIRSRLPEIKTPMLTVYDGIACIGFVLARGRDGFEAFDRNGKTVGKFKTQREAVRGIARRIEKAAS
jgi:hypothetical protein